MTFKQKLCNRISDFRDDIDFLLRKDVSARFKLLNVISGDRLRPMVAFVACRTSDAKKVFDSIPEYKKLQAEFFGGELSAEDYDAIIDRIMWYVERADKDIRDFWEM